MGRNSFVIYLNAMSPLRLRRVATTVAVYPSAMDEQPLNADILDLATHKMCRNHVAMATCGLLPHFFTLTHNGRYLSVALVLRSPSAGVTRYPCPVEPGLSSQRAFRHTLRGCPTRSGLYCNLRHFICQTSCKIFSDTLYYTG